MEKRRHQRTDCRFPVRIEHTEPLTGLSHCFSTNIGMKGIFIKNGPKHRPGTKCTIRIHDHENELVCLPAKVTHSCNEGTGYTFNTPPMQDCLKLRHIVSPSWDGRNLLDGVLLTSRYAKPRNLADCLSLTSLISTKPAELIGTIPKNCDLNQ